MPSSNNTFLHFTLEKHDYTNNNIYLYNDIAKRITTSNNVTYKNNNGYSPIHIALQEEFLYREYLNYLDNMIRESKIKIKKMPFDNIILSILHTDVNPADGMMWEYAKKYFDESTFDDAVVKYSKNRPINNMFFYYK